MYEANYAIVQMYLYTRQIRKVEVSGFAIISIYSHVTPQFSDQPRKVAVNHKYCTSKTLVPLPD